MMGLYELWVRLMVWLGAAPLPGYEYLLPEAERQAPAGRPASAAVVSESSIPKFAQADGRLKEFSRITQSSIQRQFYPKRIMIAGACISPHPSRIGRRASGKNMIQGEAKITPLKRITGPT
jgi:hypothetical protein